MSPKDPRAGSVAVAGVPWLARMIDKARLEAEGTIDALDLEYPCPMDRGLLNQLGIDSRTFQSIATTSQNDDEIVKRLLEAGAKL